MKMRIFISIWLNVMKIWLSHVIHHFLHFYYIMRLTPFDFLEVKWLNSHIFYDLCGCKDLGEVQLEHVYKLSRRKRIKWLLYLFRRLINFFYLFRRLVKPFNLSRRIFKHFHLLGGWSNHSTFLWGWSRHSTFLGGWSSHFTFWGGQSNLSTFLGGWSNLLISLGG